MSEADLLDIIAELLETKPEGVTTREISEHVTGKPYDQVVLRKLRQLHKYHFIERQPLNSESGRSKSVYTLSVGCEKLNIK